MIAGFTIGVAGGIFYELDILWVAVALFMGIFIIENLRKPIGIAYISDKLEDQTMATALSVESQAKSLFAALIAPLLGYFADSYGLGYGLALASVLLLIVAPLFLARKTKR
jgi:hypothetical protein